MRNIRYTFRMLKRNPLLSWVTIPGLAVALSAVLLLLVYINHEISFDKHFTTKNRVLRLLNDVQEEESSMVYPICLRTCYDEIPAMVPEVESAVQIFRAWQVDVKNEEIKFSDVPSLYADPEFFTVFGMDLLAGDKNTALKGMRKLVLTETLAKKLFNTTDCLGKVLQVYEQPFTVSGIAKDLPNTTHFQYDMLISLETINPSRYGGLEYFTYFLIREGADINQAAKKIEAANDQLMTNWVEQFNYQLTSVAEVLADVHLHTISAFDMVPKANKTTLNIVIIITLFILLIAVINYLNLYILHGEKRISEIASRKSMGAERSTLAAQFYTETGIIGLIALIIAIIITLYVRPFFGQLLQRELETGDLFTLSGVLMTIGILLFIVVVAGAYPTWYLSKIKLITGLKGKSESVNRKRRLSVISVFLQFAITVFLISSVFIINGQIQYLKNQPLGFQPENVVELRGFSKAVEENPDAVVAALEKLPFVESAGASFHSIGSGYSGQGLKKYGDPGAFLGINQYRVRPGIIPCMQIEMAQGRTFKKDGNDNNSVIINEKAVRMLGLENPVGTLVQMREEPLTIIGVTKDFIYGGHPGEPVEPLILTTWTNLAYALYIRHQGIYTPEMQQQVTNVIKQFDKEYIYNQTYLTDRYASKFKEEKRILKLVSVGAVVAIILSFMGLMALSFMQVNRRTKEVGVRKVMGSSVGEVMFLLMKETLIVVLLAMITAFGTGWYIMTQWLSRFTTHMPLNARYFILSGLAALVIVVLATGWQTWRAATGNPVKALRYE